MSSRLEAHNLGKQFSGETVLSGVTLVMAPGEAHALIGANGSGKSTFVKIVTGVHTPEPGGSVRIDGVEINHRLGPGAFQRAGVRVVHQDAPLVDSLSVAEMVGLHLGYPTRFGRVRWGALRRLTQDLLSRLQIQVASDRVGASLTSAERAMVTLALALADGGGEVPLLVLDEATAPLPVPEAEQFLQTVDLVRESGTAVLMVTHRLQEVTAHCDQITVLNDGRAVYQGPVSALSEKEMARHMIRASAGLAADRGSDVGADPAWLSGASFVKEGPVLRVSDVDSPSVTDLSFEINAGEILGLTGLVGSGASDIGRIVAGLEPSFTGAIEMAGVVVTPREATPRRMLDLGLAYLPADRVGESGIAVLSVRENALLRTYSNYWRRGRLEAQHLGELMELFDVVPRDPDRTFGTLSGGNQQKILLGKWLLANPRLLVLDDPTAGVDRPTRQVMFEVLRRRVDCGLAVLLISTEPAELAYHCDRVLVLREGRVSAAFNKGDLDAEKIGLAAVA